MEKLNSETAYQIGKFRILLNQTTGNLIVQVIDNDLCLNIRPKSDNSAILKAQKQILQSAKSALQSAGISNVQAGRKMGVTHQRVGALLSGEDCTLSTLIKLLETSDVYGSVMYPEPRKILAEVLNNTPARRAVAEKLGKEMRYVSSNLISSDIKLSTFVGLCEAAGCLGNVFKI